MTEEKAVEILSSLICRGRPISPVSISPDTNLVDDLGFDSLDAAELLAAVHKETGQQLDVSSVKDFHTVGSLAKKLSGSVAGGQK
ncbi:acyl carrier protein [Streptomyces sp. NPDC127079]|uniref:acyl carrier protein n=1 Tax=Streptomyces sp. NPDC127079 TaxID=3347132 RepID=UPI00365D16C0